MKIIVNTIGDNNRAVSVEHGPAKIDLGLLNRHECINLSKSLILTISQLIYDREDHKNGMDVDDQIKKLIGEIYS